MVDLSQAPLVALSNGTKELLASLLNPKRLFQTSSGFVRDWRGLAYLCEIDSDRFRIIENSSNPTEQVLTIIESQTKNFSLLNLQNALETIERWDVVDDTQKLFEKDAELYYERLQRSQSTAEEKNDETDSQILTVDDLFRMKEGQKIQHYDAFVLHAEENTDFANEVLEILENKNNMKLCLKDRDLIAGISFEHEAIMRLILERCNRLILIISPEFFQSPANKFFMNFAQAAAIDKHQERKIIPCIYKNCELPPQLRYFTKIYYSQNFPENFWKKLVCSTEVVSNVNAHNAKTKSKNINLNIQKLMEAPPDKKVEKLKYLAAKEESKTKDPPTEVENKVSDTIPHLPSLDGLSSLDSMSSVECTTKKIKKKKGFVKTNLIAKKLQSFLTKS